MSKTLIALCLILTNTLSFASDHGMTKVLGTHIDLSMKGHSFSGMVNQKIIYGRIHGQAHALADVIIDDSEKVVQVQFERNQDYFGGVILEAGNSTTLELSHILNDVSAPAIVIKIDNIEHKVSIEADGYENNHFINPKFSTQINGKNVSFKILNGESCWMNSIQLIFSIIGAYVH